MVTWLAADLLTWQPMRQYAIRHDRAVLHFFTDASDRSGYVDTLRSALMHGGHAIIARRQPRHKIALVLLRLCVQRFPLGHQRKSLRQCNRR